MVVLLGLGLAAATGVLPGAVLPPAVVGLVLGMGVLVYCEGVAAPIEFLSTVGNMLSYARLMALGTASVMLAAVANELAGKTGSLLLGIVVGLLFHLVNLALGLFSPTIHSLRLHYVEFFGKFYDPGGRAYRPFVHWTPDTKRP
jgi:V/A-type H+-transporting ATPase subunit I